MGRIPTTDVEYILSGIVLILMVLIYVFRKWISYLYCPLEKYEGRYYGKSYYTFFIHIFTSAFVAISLFIFVSNSFDLIDLFERKSNVRIISFISLFLFIFLIIGFLIDKYLVATDKKYNEWKKNKQKNK